MPPSICNRHFPYQYTATSGRDRRPYSEPHDSAGWLTALVYETTLAHVEDRALLGSRQLDPALLLDGRILPDISHIKPGVSKEPTILDVDDCTDAPERCQTSYCAYWTTFWCGGWCSVGWESHLRYTIAPFQPLHTRTSPLVTPHRLR